MKKIKIYEMDNLTKAPVELNYTLSQWNETYIQTDDSGKETVVEKKYELYPFFNKETMVVTDETLSNPILENGVLRDKTPTELKLENPDLLEDGEHILLNEIIKVEKPSDFRIWNKLTNTWNIDDELIAHHINDLTNELSSIRDSKLEVGTLFEGDKLIKGRTQDVSDAIAQVMLKQLGGEIKWFFSNNITEEDITLDRMMVISTEIGGFRTYQFGREKEVFHHITQVLTNEEAETFNPSLYW